ncbi:MAG: acyltransferase 3 [Marmoricola sp.]|nr:acyltransferase 3 [Marmoricola sp.]
MLERTTVPEATPEPLRARRDPWFDNIKMTLVTLVVVGHSWALLPNTTTESWAYNFLYSWHIPAFAMITGYFSRSFAWTPAKLRNLVLTVAVPYFVFEAAVSYYREWTGGITLHHLFLHPHYPMWYLVALFFWRLAAPAFQKLPAYAAVAVAVAIGVTGGFYAPDLLDANRLLGFLPFFVVGLTFGSRQWQRIRSPRAVPWAVVGLVGVFVLARFTDSWISTDWYYSTQRFGDLGASGIHAVLIKAALLGIGLVAALSVFALVPRGRGWFSTMGSATMVVYLFHGFVVMLTRYRGYPQWADTHANLAFVIATLGAVVLALGLALPPVARRLSVAVDPFGALERRLRTPAPTPG